MFLTLCLMFASTAYHVCDHPTEEDLGGNCMMPFDGLYLMDFLMSVLVLVNVLTYHMPLRLDYVRETALVAMFVALIYMYEAMGTFQSLGFYLVGLFMALALFGVRLYHGSIRVTWLGVLTLVLFACGFVFYFTDTRYPQDYQTLHSFWHIFAALGMTAGFCYFDREEERCRANRRDVFAARSHVEIQLC
jgi:peptidoglycan/LPS O-acetylase OafA/YrhL